MAATLPSVADRTNRSGGGGLPQWSGASYRPPHDLAHVDAFDVHARVLQGEELARELDRLVAVVGEDVFSDRVLGRVRVEQEFHRVHVCHRRRASGDWRGGNYSKLPTESWARLSKRVYSPKNLSLIDPVGPLRCLPMITSASPLSGEFSLL